MSIRRFAHDTLPMEDDMTTDTAAATTTTPRLRPLGRRADLGIVAAVVTAAAFGTSGPFAKALLTTGWSSGAIVLLRVGLAALVLAVPAVLASRGRWDTVRQNLTVILVFGLVAVAGCQVAYFNAVGTLSVGVALLLEYSGTVLVVVWVWLRTRRAPSRLTLAGGLAALAGLALVLDIAGQSRPDPVGVVWGLLAAVGLAAYFVASSSGDGGLPPVALAGFGMGVGAVALAALGAVGVVPMQFRSADVLVAGLTLPWWVAVGELALVAAAFAYLLGTYAVRALGATVASFVGLSEVLFAIVFAWLLLGELPRPVQLAGGAVVVAGVVAVRLGESRAEASNPR
jgi:drug/metabolite transporter (DMT)-like permease